jgi:hypothetical protein
MMSIFYRAVAKALFGAVSTILLGGCAIVYDYSDYVACRGNESTGNGLGSAKWIFPFGTTFTPSLDSAQSVVVSNAGDIYFAAEFQGGVTIADQFVKTDGQYMLALAKLDGSGKQKWGIQLGERTPGMPDTDKGQRFIANLAIDNMSRPIVGGTFDGKLDFGEMSLRLSQGYPDAFLQKRNAQDGSFSSGDSYGQQDSQFGFSVAADTNGSTVMTGYFKNAIDFNGKCALDSVGEYNIFVAKFDNTGACEWSKNFGTGNLDYGAGITIDANNHIAVVGTYNGTLDFGKDAAGKPITLTSNTSGTGFDHFLLELDSKGTPLLAKTFASAPLVGIFVTSDPCGNTFVVENVRVNLDMPNTYSLRVHKFSPEGALAWTKNFMSSGSIEATSIDADATGHLLIAGSFAGLADLGNFSITADAAGDAFILSLNGASDGTPLASTSLQGPGNQTVTAIRRDPTGGVVVVGNFEASITAASLDTIIAPIGTDVFVAKFAP